MFDLAQITQQAAPWLQRYGYAALAIGVAAEGIGIPLPGATLMGGAALLAGQGEMSLPGVLFAAWSASVAGDNLGYWLGRRGGRRLLLRSGVSRQRLLRLGRFYRRFGLGLILVGRFFDGTRQLNGLVAGSTRIPWPRFLLVDLLGAGMWVAFWVFGLYTLDRHLAWVHTWLVQLNPWVVAASLVAVLAALLLLYAHHDPRRGGRK